jgi:hypothetical protein
MDLDPGRLEAGDAPNVGRWGRPTSVSIKMCVTLSTAPVSTEASFGWQVWGGEIFAAWSLDSNHGVPLSDDTLGWGGAPIEIIEGDLHLPIGSLERLVLSLTTDDLGVGSNESIGGPDDLFDAADHVSQQLHDVVAPIVGDDQLLRDECYSITGMDWFSRLLVLQQVEILPQIRGLGVGAWASARSIRLLAPDEFTLIVTKAAPLRAAEFREATIGDQMTGPEQAKWDAAQRKISSHWQDQLGLRPLSSDPEILIGNTTTCWRALDRAFNGW